MRSASFPTTFTRPPEGAVSTLAHYIAKMALTPRAGAAQLRNDPRRLRIGVAAWLVAGGLSAGTLFLAQARGFGTVLMSVIPLPAEQYHFWRALLAIVALMVILAAAAGVAQLSLRLLGPARGTFEDAVSVIALATWLPFIALWWLPATVLALSPTGAPFPAWFDATRVLAAPLWILAAQVPALRHTHGLSLPRSLLAAGTGLVVAAALFAAFLR